MILMILTCGVNKWSQKSFKSIEKLKIKNFLECLADAYLNRGSLIASLKSFNKAIELNPDSIYAAYQ